VCAAARVEAVTGPHILHMEDVGVSYGGCCRLRSGL